MLEFSYLTGYSPVHNFSVEKKNPEFFFKHFFIKISASLNLAWPWLGLLLRRSHQTRPYPGRAPLVPDFGLSVLAVGNDLELHRLRALGCDQKVV